MIKANEVKKLHFIYMIPGKKKTPITIKITPLYHKIVSIY